MSNSKSGEAMIIGAVVALVGSILVSYFSAANDAQLAANASGQEVSVIDMVDGGDVVQALIATGVGAAAGWGVEELKDNGKDDKPKVPTMQVTSGRDTVVSIGEGGASNYQSQPTTTTTTPAPTPTVTP